MHFITSLTVSESKRLIARGVVADERVSENLVNGRVAITPGTTNGYVMEEIIAVYPGLNWETVFSGAFDKTQFVAGRTLPHEYDGPALKNTLPAVLIDKGELSVMSAQEAAEQLEPGDVFLKGVNAINYERGQAAVLIGHPTGGNVGEAIGAVVARRVCYLHPVGLEKQIGVDLDEVAGKIAADSSGKGPTLWVVPGPLFTEIEALSVLCGVEAVPISSGGVGGAEGAIWLMVCGNDANVEKARQILDDLSGESEFISR